MTPGVKKTEGKDNLGQQYVTPVTAIIENDSDIIIVGRGVITAKDPQLEAADYRALAWRAYLEKTKQG